MIQSLESYQLDDLPISVCSGYYYATRVSLGPNQAQAPTRHSSRGPSLMTARSRSPFESSNQKHERHSQQHKPPKRRKAIHKRQVSSLPLQQIERPRLRVNHSVRMCETVRRKILREVAEKLLISRIERRGVRHQHRLMILRSGRQQRGDKRNPETSALVSKKIGQAGSFIILLLWQIGVRQLADRYE